jgi:hypothetical protein
MFRAVKTIVKRVHTRYRLTASCLLPGILLLLCSPVSVHADEHLQAEYQIKAAFLYNFARFTSWPEHTSSAFRLCVLGDDPFGEALDALAGKSIHNEPLVVAHAYNPAELDGCELVYISTSYTGKLDKVIALLREQTILTVSDIDAFIDQGGIIGFRIIENKVRFEINASAAATAGLSISSRLLSLASRVSMDR